MTTMDFDRGLTEKKKSYLAAVREVAEEKIKPCSRETIGVQKRYNSEKIGVETSSHAGGEEATASAIDLTASASSI